MLRSGQARACTFRSTLVVGISSRVSSVDRSNTEHAVSLLDEAVVIPVVTTSTADLECAASCSKNPLYIAESALKKINFDHKLSTFR